MKAAIVYSSITGNTKELANIIYQLFINREVDVKMFPIGELPLYNLEQFDLLAIGTYTWGNGEIPKEMNDLYAILEERKRKNLVTGIFGTGDSFYTSFCGAVDLFRDMLYIQTNLAVTLKVELMPQLQDFERCEKFVALLMRRKSHVLI